MRSSSVSWLFSSSGSSQWKAALRGESAWFMAVLVSNAFLWEAVVRTAAWRSHYKKTMPGYLSDLRQPFS
jgi:ABC-type transport system involved in multi-copper enzyme maturation permease subunit